MNKKLILSSMLMLSFMLPSFADTPTQIPLVGGQRPVLKRADIQKPPMSREKAEKQKAAFEKRLNLTDEQKAKAEELRKQDHQEMRPLMEAIKTKHEELDAAKKANSSEEEIKKIKSDIGELHKKLHEQKMQNMKDFEAILTDKQLKELKKMKEEGRKKFEKDHKGYKGQNPALPRAGHGPAIMPKPEENTK